MNHLRPDCELNRSEECESPAQMNVITQGWGQGVKQRHTIASHIIWL